MQSRVFIVHGWDGTPEEGWFPWLKRELEARGFRVTVPQLPNASRPRIQAWVPALAAAVGTPDARTFFVGHSLGCQTIARYLESLSADTVIGGAVFVAGFFKQLTNVASSPEETATARHWLETPLDLEQVRMHLPRSLAIFSDNDPYVPLDNQTAFRDRLGSAIAIEHERGHFSGSDGVTELPIALESLLRIAAP